MINYINNILIKCKDQLNYTELLEYLLKIYPITASILFDINHTITLETKIHKISSTLLCPKLFLMYRLKNLFINQQSNILIKFLDTNKINECANQILSIYHNFQDIRLITILLEDILRIILIFKIKEDIKYSMLDRWEES